MQFIKSLFPAIRAASCSWTSKWFSHKKQLEDASLHNTASDPGKLRDLRKHSLLHQLRYTMTTVFQSFQGLIITWSPHWKNKQKKPPNPPPNPNPNKPTWKIYFPVSLPSLWGSFSLPQSNRLQAQEVQAIRNHELKIPAAHKHAVDQLDVLFWRK